MVKKVVTLSLVLLFAASAAYAANPDGKALFDKNCAACHENGGNMINPKKTLSKKDRAVNGVKSANDIVKLMRNPGQGMTKFDADTLPDNDAKAIANYVQKAFK